MRKKKQIEPDGFTTVILKNKTQQFKIVTEEDAQLSAVNYYNRLGLVGVYDCETSKGFNFKVG